MFVDAYKLIEKRKKKMKMYITCDYCGAEIEYDESSINIAIGSPNAVYVECPVCGEMVIVGTMPYPEFV